MRVQHDQRQKGTLRALLERAGTVQTEEEISPAPQRIDLWFVPDPSLDCYGGG